MNAAALARTEQGHTTHEEIAWLASFGWTIAHIALRLDLGQRGGPAIPELRRQVQHAITMRRRFG